MNGYQVLVHTPWGEGEFIVPLLGRYNVSNVLAVLCVLGIMDIPLEKALHYLESLKTVSGRMQIFGGGNEPTCVVDYAHTPDALQKTLQALREHCENKLWCVFGCGGNRDCGKRPQMAKIAEQYCDRIIITNDNPRLESPEQIVNDIFSGFKNPKEVRRELDRAAAIEYAVQTAEKGDVVLIAGKGHENYQIIGEQKIVFSDSQNVIQQLRLRGFGNQH